MYHYTSRENFNLEDDLPTIHLSSVEEGNIHSISHETSPLVIDLSIHLIV
jgi:hypothetical protein